MTSLDIYPGIACVRIGINKDYEVKQNDFRGKYPVRIELTAVLIVCGMN